MTEHSASRRLRPLSLIGAFLIRDWTTAWSYRFPFIGDVVGTFAPLLLFFFIGRLVDMGQIDLPELEAGYFAFVVVGTAVIGIVEEGLGSYASRISSAQRTGTLEAMAASPTPLWLTTFLGSLYDVIHAAITSSLTVAVAIIFFGIRLNVDPSALPLLLVAIISSVLLFSALGLLAAALTFVFKRAGAFTDNLDFLIAAASGVWFPLEVLPGPLATVARLLPFTWAVDMMRLALLNGEVPVGRTALLALSALVVLPISLWFTAKSIDYARRQGSLAYY